MAQETNKELKLAMMALPSPGAVKSPRAAACNDESIVQGVTSSEATEQLVRDSLKPLGKFKKHFEHTVI